MNLILLVVAGQPLLHMIEPLAAYDSPHLEGHKLGFVRVCHDWGERRLISSGDSMAYEYAIRGCPVFALLWMLRRSFAEDISTVNLMALRETTEDLTEFTPGRCRYD